MISSYRFTLRSIALLGGSAFVTVWTIIRSLTNGVNFDVVGQIGVADQWAHGFHDAAQFGATNYLVKLPLYFLVNSLGFLSPHAKLLLLALICNLATFLLLVLLAEKILCDCGVRLTAWFYLAVLWLASISGRIFWLDYANSRNLETVGGLLVLWLVLRLLARTGWQRAAILAAVSGPVFFVDQLQLYTIGGGLVLYGLFSLLGRGGRQQLRLILLLGGAVLSGFFISKLLLIAATALLPLTFLVAPASNHAADIVSVHGLAKILSGLVQNTLRLFDSSFYSASSLPNQLRQLLNSAVFVSILAVCLQRARSRSSFKGRGVIICCLIAAYAAYILSGQAAQYSTERYLIMVPLLLLLLFAGQASPIALGPARPLQRGWIVILCLSAILASGALVVSWPQRYSKDASISVTLQYLQQHHYRYAASWRGGIVETYFSEQQAVIAPYICQPDHRLVASNLFFDQAGIKAVQRQTGPVPLIVPTGGIVSSGAVCSLADIRAQFGPALSEEPVGTIGTALLYNRPL